MRIGFGGLADVARRYLSAGFDSLTRTVDRLGSGWRINAAVDDAAGLAISQGLTARIDGSAQGARNAQDGVGLVQTAEGGLSSMHGTLQRMRTLAVQSANGTYGAADREAMQAEFISLVEEIDGVVARTEFNGQRVLDGTVAGRRLQVGAEAGDVVMLDVARFDSVGLGLRDAGAALPTSLTAATPPTSPFGGVATATAGTAATAEPTVAATDPSIAPVGTTTDASTTATSTPGRTNRWGKAIGGATKTTTTPTTTPAPTTTTTTTPTTSSSTGTATPAPFTSAGWAVSILDGASAQDAIGVIDDAIWAVSHGRADLGATQTRLERSIRSADRTHDALAAARSRIQDADMAGEAVSLVRTQILVQAATAMTSQAMGAERRAAEMLLR